MDRDDWIVVGARLLGLYLLAKGLLGGLTGIAGLAVMGNQFQATAGPLGTGMVQVQTNAGIVLGVSTGLSVVLGIALFLGAPALMEWVKVKDSRVQDRQRARRDLQRPRRDRQRPRRDRGDQPGT